MTSSDRQSPPSGMRPYPLTLNTLPPEVRGIIYEYLVPMILIAHNHALVRCATVPRRHTYKIKPPRALLSTLIFRLGKQVHEDAMHAISKAPVTVAGAPRHPFTPEHYNFPPFIFTNVHQLCPTMRRIDDLFGRQEYDVNVLPNLSMVWAGPPPSTDIRVNLRYPGDILSFVAECLRDQEGPEELALSNGLLSHFQHFIDTQAHIEGYPTEPFRRTMEYLSRTDVMIRCGHTLFVRVMATRTGSGPRSRKVGLLDEEYHLVSGP